MGKPLDKLSIRGFKSIRLLENLELGCLNVLVGANGAGKSNFIDFFRLLRAMSEEQLQSFAIESGGADGFFFGGPKETSAIEAELNFGINGYKFALAPTATNSFLIKSEYTYCKGAQWHFQPGNGHESQLRKWRGKSSKYGPYLGEEAYVHDAVSGWTIYHFHDTSKLAPMRRDHSVADWRELHPDASNIAAFLVKLKERHNHCYQSIVDQLRLIAPFFDDFLLEPELKGDNELIRLQWRQKSSSFPFQPWQFSDGTLRFICLATTLLQPSLPSTVIIDEPELGLHPLALDALASLFRSASERTQLIVSTQSVTLLNHFEPEEVIVADRKEGASSLRRLDKDELQDWLSEYSLGELWQKNVFDGGPVHE